MSTTRNWPSLSSCLCKWVLGRLEVGVDSVGVGDGQLAECLFPVGGDLAFDQAARSGALIGGSASLFLTFSGAFVFDGADGQPEQFDDGLVAGEMSAVFDDLAQLI